MHGLYAKLENILRYIISLLGIFLDPAKVPIVIEWKRPKTIKDVQTFLCVVNFYQRFIKNYFEIALPLP